MPPGRILIVDSDEALRSVLCRALYAHGVNGEEMSDGSRAVEAIRSGDYAVVLLDLDADVVSGFEVLRTIHGEHPDTTIIALASSSEEVKRLAGEPLVALSINKTFAVRNIEPVAAAIVAVSRMR